MEDMQIKIVAKDVSFTSSEVCCAAPHRPSWDGLFIHPTSIISLLDCDYGQDVATWCPDSIVAPRHVMIHLAINQLFVFPFVIFLLFLQGFSCVLCEVGDLCPIFKNLHLN